jgi:hypothetical protein
MSGIYKGYNPVFESLQKEIFEQEQKAAKPSALSRAIYDVFTSLIMSGKDEAIKTPEGFKAAMDQILKSTSLEGIKTEILKKVDGLIQTDKDQAEALQQSKTYIAQLLDQLVLTVGGKADLVKSVIDDMNSYIGGTVSGLQSVKAQLQQNESLVSKYVSERKRTGDEGSPAEGIDDKKWWVNLSKSCLDTAVSFSGETESALTDKRLSSNAEMQKFSEMSQKFIEDARKLAVTGRAGLLNTGKIETEGGKMKGEQYRVAATNLVNEILRQRNLFRQLRNSLTNIPTPPVQDVPVVCPSGFVYDANKKACVAKPSPAPTPGPGPSPSPTPTPTPSSGCEFPIKMSGKKCPEVKAVQEKLMSMGSCIKDILAKRGGADGKYGKTTAKLCNITYAYLTGATSFSELGDLSKAMYDVIMSGSATIAAKESYYAIPAADFQKIMERKIFEKESESAGSVISFDDFAKILNEDEVAAVNPPAPTVSLADCICKTYASGAIDAACAKTIVPVPVPDPDKEDDKKVWEWKGLKPLPDGIYGLSYDESWGEWWASKGTAIGIGVILVVAIAATAGAFAPAGVAAAGAAGAGGTAAGAGAAVAGAEVAAAGTAAAGTAATVAGAEVAAGAATAAGAEVAAGTAATKVGLLAKLGTAIKGASLAGAQAGAMGALTSPVAIGAGAIGGAAADSLFDGRSGVGISLFNGYISKTGIVSIARGLSDTYDGYVTKEDIQAFMASLCILRGAWTDRNGKPVSAWGEVKRRYMEMETGENIDQQLGKGEYGTTFVRSVENFPDIESDNMEDGSKVNSDDAKKLIEEAVALLDANEADLLQNLSNITEEEIKEVKKGVKIVKTSESEESEAPADKTEAPASPAASGANKI